MLVRWNAQVVERLCYIKAAKIKKITVVGI